MAVYGAIVMATVAGAEMLARLYDWSPRSRHMAADDGLGQRRYYHATEGYGDLVAGQDGHWVIWFHRPYHVQTNSAGLRNVEEKSEKAFRILAVGDSQTFGPYLANEDTWPAWTEYYLRQRADKADVVQVFNAGISGYTIIDELNYLRDKGVAFKPSLVVLGVYENDLYDLRKEKNGTVQRPTGDQASRLATALKVLGRSSALVTLAVGVKSRFQLAAAGVDTRQADVGVTPTRAMPADHDALADRYRALFRDLVTLLKAHSIGLAVLFIPGANVVAGDAPSEMEPLIRELMHDVDVPYLDLTAIMRAEKDAVVRLFLLQRSATGDGWVGNAHSSREGNAVIGRAVATWLVDRSLIAK